METWRWLQRRFPRDMRRLYELLDTLDEAALAAQRRLTVPFIREVLRAAAPGLVSRAVTRQLHGEPRHALAQCLRQRLLLLGEQRRAARRRATCEAP